jgi:hypothetical protein
MGDTNISQTTATVRKTSTPAPKKPAVSDRPAPSSNNAGFSGLGSAAVGISNGLKGTRGMFQGLSNLTHRNQ